MPCLLWEQLMCSLRHRRTFPVLTLSLHPLESDLCPFPGDNVLVSFSNKDSRDFTCKVSLLEHAALTNISMQLSKDLGWSALPASCLKLQAASAVCVCWQVANFGCSQVCTGSGRQGQPTLFCAAPELLMKAQHTKVGPPCWEAACLRAHLLNAGSTLCGGLPVRRLACAQAGSARQPWLAFLWQAEALPCLPLCM